MDLARGEWRVEDTAEGWTLLVRPRLGGMFWVHIIYAAGWLALGALFAASTPVAMLLVLLPAAWAMAAAWNLAHDVVALRVEGDVGALGIAYRKPDSWRTFRLEHLSTIQLRRMSGVRVAGLWFLQLRTAGRAYGSDYFGPLGFVSYGSKVFFGGALPADIAGAVLDRISANVSSAVKAPNKGIERTASALD